MTEALEREIRTLRAHFWSERDPDGRAFAPLADAYLRKGDLDEAHALLDDGLGRLPEFTSGHLVAARVHRARGDESAFRGAVERLLELDAENAAGLRLRGELLEGDGDLDGALGCFERALDLNPEYDDLESRITRLRIESADRGNREGSSDRLEQESRIEQDQDPEPIAAAVDDESVEVRDSEESTLDPEDVPDGKTFVEEGDWGEKGDFSLDTFGSVDLTDPDPSVDADPDRSDLEVEEREPGDSATGDPLDLAWEEGTRVEDTGEEVVREDAFDLEPSPEAALESDRGSPVPDAAGWAPGTGSRALSDADREVVLEGDPAGELPGSESPPDGAGEEALEAGPPDDSLGDEPSGGTADAAPPVPRNEGSPTVTRTLAELYARQGLTGRAVEIFEELVRREPDDPALESRLAELRAEGGGVVEPRPERPESVDHAPDPAPDEEADEVEDRHDDATRFEPVDEREPVDRDEPHDDRAPQWTDDAGEEEAPEVSTPFAWDRTGDADQDEVDAPDTSMPASGRSIAEYLGDLRAWEPGAIPIEALDPEAVPIQELAPEESDLPTTSTAADSRTQGGDVPMDEGGEGDLDDFQDWLRGLRS